MMRFLFHFLFGVLLLVFLAGIWNAFITYAGLLPHSRAFVPLLIGSGLGMIVDGILVRVCPSAEVWEHELTHAIAGLPFGLIPTRIAVTPGRGGICEHRGCTPTLLYPFACDFTSLAPYFLPTATVILVACRPLVTPVFLHYYDVAVGLTFGYHVLSSLRETRRSWTLKKFRDVDDNITHSDIGHSGLIFSTIYIVVMNLVLVGVLLAVILKGYPGLGAWGQRVWTHTVPVAVYLWEEITRTVGP